MSAGTVDRSSILALAAQGDDVGILSIYAGVTPGAEADTATALRVALHELERDAGRDRRPAVHDRLAALEETIEDILEPRSHGRGHALFAGVASGDVTRIDLQLPVPTAASLGGHPWLRPLLRAVVAGRPAGAVAVSRDAVRLVALDLGEAEDVARFDVDVDTTGWRTMRGRSDPNPTRAQHSASQEDRLRRRAERERATILRGVAAEVKAVATSRRWGAIVVAGPDEPAAELSGALENGVGLVRVAIDLPDHLSASEVAATLMPALASVRAAQAEQVVERVRGAALSGGRGALGLADVLTALAEGRIAELLLDATHELRGVATPDGTLYPADVIPPGVDPSALRDEPNLSDVLCARALAEGAELWLVDGDAGDALAPHDGVAALLRW